MDEAACSGSSGEQPSTKKIERLPDLTGRLAKMMKAAYWRDVKTPEDLKLKLFSEYPRSLNENGMPPDLVPVYPKNYVNITSPNDLKCSTQKFIMMMQRSTRFTRISDTCDQKKMFNAYIWQTVASDEILRDCMLTEMPMNDLLCRFAYQHAPKVKKTSSTRPGWKRTSVRVSSIESLKVDAERFTSAVIKADSVLKCKDLDPSFVATSTYATAVRDKALAESDLDRTVELLLYNRTKVRDSISKQSLRLINKQANFESALRGCRSVQAIETALKNNNLSENEASAQGLSIQTASCSDGIGIHSGSVQRHKRGPKGYAENCGLPVKIPKAQHGMALQTVNEVAEGSVSQPLKGINNEQKLKERRVSVAGRISKGKENRSPPVVDPAWRNARNKRSKCYDRQNMIVSHDDDDLSLSFFGGILRDVMETEQDVMTLLPDSSSQEVAGSSSSQISLEDNLLIQQTHCGRPSVGSDGTVNATPQFPIVGSNSYSCMVQPKSTTVSEHAQPPSDLDVPRLSALPGTSNDFAVVCLPYDGLCNPYPDFSDASKMARCGRKEYMETDGNPVISQVSCTVGGSAISGIVSCISGSEISGSQHVLFSSQAAMRASGVNSTDAGVSVAQSVSSIQVRHSAPCGTSPLSARDHQPVSVNSSPQTHFPQNQCKKAALAFPGTQPSNQWGPTGVSNASSVGERITMHGVSKNAYIHPTGGLAQNPSDFTCIRVPSSTSMYASCNISLPSDAGGSTFTVDDHVVVSSANSDSRCTEASDCSAASTGKVKPQQDWLAAMEASNGSMTSAMPSSAQFSVLKYSTVNVSRLGDHSVQPVIAGSNENATYICARQPNLITPPGCVQRRHSSGVTDLAAVAAAGGIVTEVTPCYGVISHAHTIGMNAGNATQYCPKEFPAVPTDQVNTSGYACATSGLSNKELDLKLSSTRAVRCQHGLFQGAETVEPGTVAEAMTLMPHTTPCHARSWVNDGPLPDMDVALDGASSHPHSVSEIKRKEARLASKSSVLTGSAPRPTDKAEFSPVGALSTDDCICSTPAAPDESNQAHVSKQASDGFVYAKVTSSSMMVSSSGARLLSNATSGTSTTWVPINANAISGPSYTEAMNSAVVTTAITMNEDCKHNSLAAKGTSNAILQPGIQTVPLDAPIQGVDGSREFEVSVGVDIAQRPQPQYTDGSVHMDVTEDTGPQIEDGCPQIGNIEGAGYDRFAAQSLATRNEYAVLPNTTKPFGVPALCTAGSSASPKMTSSDVLCDALVICDDTNEMANYVQNDEFVIKDHKEVVPNYCSKTPVAPLSHGINFSTWSTDVGSDAQGAVARLEVSGGNDFPETDTSLSTGEAVPSTSPLQPFRTSTCTNCPLASEELTAVSGSGTPFTYHTCENRTTEMGLAHSDTEDSRPLYIVESDLSTAVECNLIYGASLDTNIVSDDGISHHGLHGDSLTQPNSHEDDTSLCKENRSSANVYPSCNISLPSDAGGSTFTVDDHVVVSGANSDSRCTEASDCSAASTGKVKPQQDWLAAMCLTGLQKMTASCAGNLWMTRSPKCAVANAIGRTITTASTPWTYLKMGFTRAAKVQENLEMSTSLILSLSLHNLLVTPGRGIRCWS